MDSNIERSIYKIYYMKLMKNSTSNLKKYQLEKTLCAIKMKQT